MATKLLRTKLLRSLTAKNVSLLEVQNSGHVLAQLKNLGVAWSEQRFGRGDFLHIGDSDVYFMPGWNETLADFANRSIGARYALWGGQVHPFHRPINTERLDTSFTEHDVLDGPSWFMWWETWDAFGPFDRNAAPGVCQSEEFPFCKRLREPEQQAFYLLDGVEPMKPCRIGVVQPHVVIHTGLTNSNGDPAPGAEQRRALIPPGVIAE